jgi:uncharacterized protein (TIGR02611 family)
MGITPGTRSGARTPLRAVRLIAVTIVGGLLLVAGIAALVLPGPGMLLCILGLIVLSTEYAWAQRSLRWARRKSQQSIQRSAASKVATYGSLAAGVALLGVGMAELFIGLPLVTALSASLLLLSGLVVVGTTGWSRLQYLRSRPKPAHVPDGNRQQLGLP